MKKNYDFFKNASGPILIEGETGTGKSRLAKEIHLSSRRSKEKFITLHMGAIKEDLLESELFGHSKGAFTGAYNERKGYCENVGEGTLFLDEISELSRESQRKLLFLLEEKKFIPVGSSDERSFNGRIIASTNLNLKKMVQDGRFREDLYYRLSVFTVDMPSIRNNVRKIRELAEYYFSEYKKISGKHHLVLSEEVLEWLCKYNWPGNVRELKNCMEYAVAHAESIVQMQDLPNNFVNGKKEDCQDLNMDLTFCPDSTCLNFNQAKEMFEKNFIERQLIVNDGKINQTARVLKISKSTLITKVRNYDINTYEIKAKKFKKRPYQIVGTDAV